MERIPPKYFGYYDSDNFTDTPDYDPGDCECIICLTKMKIDVEDIKIIEGLIRDKEKGRGYFFRIHRSCWNGLTKESQDMYINSLMKNLDFKDVELIKSKDDININIEKSKINLVTGKMLDLLIAEGNELSDIKEKFNIGGVLQPIKRKVIVFNNTKKEMIRYIENYSQNMGFKTVFID